MLSMVRDGLPIQGYPGCQNTLVQGYQGNIVEMGSVRIQGQVRK